jgi:hypothetical protein
VKGNSQATSPVKLFMKTNTHREAQQIALAARFAKPSREQGPGKGSDSVLGR